MVPHFSFWTTPLSFPDKISIIFRLPTNNDGKDMFWEFVSFLKHCYRHVECLSDIPAKEVGKGRKLFAHCLKLVKTFNCFWDFLFTQNVSIDMRNAALTGPPNCFCSMTGNDPKKTTKDGKTFWERLFFKMFRWTVGKQFENPAEFFWLPASRCFSTRYWNKNYL